MVVGEYRRYTRYSLFLYLYLIFDICSLFRAFTVTEKVSEETKDTEDTGLSCICILSEIHFTSIFPNPVSLFHGRISSLSVRCLQGVCPGLVTFLQLSCQYSLQAGRGLVEGVRYVIRAGAGSQIPPLIGLRVKRGLPWKTLPQCSIRRRTDSLAN